MSTPPDAAGAEGWTHLDGRGAARMVSVGDKPETVREAVAEAVVRMQATTLERIREQQVGKGDALAVARVAGIMAAKETSRLIPLCHPLPLEHASVELVPQGDTMLRVRASVRTSGKTGVEMEALTAATMAALTVYDMCKSMDRGMEIASVRLLRKSGGRSGVYEREGLDGPDLLSGQASGTTCEVDALGGLSL